MKKYFTFLLAAFLLLACCARDKESAKSPEEIAFEKAKTLITQMGYDTSDMYEYPPYGYVVEGDILITQEYLDEYESKPQTRHTFNKDGRAVSENKQKLNMVISDYSNLSTYVSYATQDWNEKTDCNIIFDQSASVSMQVNFIEFPNNDYATLMLVTPPNAAGAPGEIKINTKCTYLPSDDQAKYMILHAIGHAIGFGHTPKDSSEKVSDTYIEGTVKDDNSSIMVKESYPLRWTGISKYDIEAFKIKYPKKDPVPEPEPDPEPMPEPEINPGRVDWVFFPSNFAISLKTNNIKDNENVNYGLYINYDGTEWKRNDSQIKYIRFTSISSDEKIFGKITDSFNLPYGEYMVDCGIAVKNSSNVGHRIRYGRSETNLKVNHSLPKVTTNLDPKNVDFSNVTYRLYCSFDSGDINWEYYTATAKMINKQTGKEVVLRLSAGQTKEWQFTLNERANYLATVIVSNGRETKTGTLSIDLLGNKPTSPVYYKMMSRYESYTNIPVDAYIRYYLEFYSDAACTQRIQSTPYCIVFDYKLWEYYYNIHSVLQTSRITSEDRCIVPPKSYTFDLPILIPNHKPFTLDKYVYKYELTGFGYM